jgi:hypothetical protein
MPALAAKYGARYGGVPPLTLELDTQMTSPAPRSRIPGSTARLTRWVDSTFTSYSSASCSGVNASAGPTTMWPAL